MAVHAGVGSMAVAGSSGLAAAPSHVCCFQRQPTRFATLFIRQTFLSQGVATSIVCQSRHSSSSSCAGASSRTPSTLGTPTSCCKSTMYDNPAIYSNDDAFSERLYWDKRYQQDPTTFEWYRSYDSLKHILSRHLPKQHHILQLGVGTSRLQEDMADDAYSHITSIDYSPVAIQRLQQTYPARPQLDYAVADARAMPQYESSSFGGVLDKGTLDALLCGDDDVGASAQLLGEVWRLLGPGGAYVMITSAGPKSRLQYLQTPATPWQQVIVFEVGQQGAMNGPFTCSDGSSSSSSGQCAEPADTAAAVSAASSEGSASVSTEENSAAAAAASQVPQLQCAGGLEAALKLPQMGYSHMVYVCSKPH